MVALAAVGLFADGAAAVLLDALDPARQWKVERIEFSGNNTVSTGELSDVILTKARPWYRFWEERPVIDPITFASDLERLQRFYESRGYYGTSITYDRPTIAGHRDYKAFVCGRKVNDSTCPGDRLYSMLPQIRAAIVAGQPPLRAVFTQHDTPGSLAPGASVDVHLTVRNSGSLTWQADGQGAVSLGYRWLTPDGKPVKSGWKDVKAPLSRDVPFADTITVTAKLNALGYYPKKVAKSQPQKKSQKPTRSSPK